MNNFKIGDVVVKKSGKPFKSTFKKATIKGFCDSQYPGKSHWIPSATFEEDESTVSLCQLKLA